MDEGPYVSPESESLGGGLEPDQDARTIAMLCHLIALVSSILGPLLVWLLKKDDSPFIDEQGKESLNFQISIMIYCLIAGASFLCLVGIVLLPAVAIFNIVMIIIAAVKTNSGEHFRYPLCIRFIK